MSPFLSERHWRRQQWLGRPIGHDTLCANCGYNVRGLTYGRNCPECGVTIPPPMGDPNADDRGQRAAWAADIRFGLPHDVIDGSPPNARQCWKVALTLVVTALVAAALVRPVHALFSALAPTYHPGMYAGVNAAAGVLWVLGVWLSTPASVDNGEASWRRIRLGARALNVLWLPATAALAVRVAGPAGWRSDAWTVQAACTLPAVLGAGGYLAIMLRTAVGAELEMAARRINASLWLLPIVIVVLRMMPGTVPWTIWILIMGLILLWTWLMLRLAVGLWEMRQHAAWTLRYREGRHARQLRVDAVRQELDAEIAARVRDLPRRDGVDEVPLSDRGGDEGPSRIMHTPGIARRTRRSSDLS